MLLLDQEASYKGSTCNTFFFFFFTCKPSDIVAYGFIAVTILCIFEMQKHGILLQRLYWSNELKLA